MMRNVILKNHDWTVNCLKQVLDLNLNNDISWLIFFYFVEQIYNFTVRTVNDANDSTSEPSQPIICKTKAGGKTFLQ